MIKFKIISFYGHAQKLNIVSKTFISAHLEEVQRAALLQRSDLIRNSVVSEKCHIKSFSQLFLLTKKKKKKKGLPTFKVLGLVVFPEKKTWTKNYFPWISFFFSSNQISRYFVRIIADDKNFLLQSLVYLNLSLCQLDPPPPHPL